jgi:LytR cell envelope-related transcriptional attenuator
MQTRKRAKSVTFGKKEKKEKEVAEEKAEELDVKKSSEKAEVVERRPVSEKPQAEELSSTLPETTKELSKDEVETPENEFVSDNPSVDATEHEPEGEVSSEPAAPAIEPPKEEEKPASQEPSVSSEAQPQETVPTDQSTQSSESQELSPTLPPSAFTIQNGENEISSKPEPEKKRFGVYFFVVAFLAFILGLGAMAAVSYFGLISLPLPKLSLTSNVGSLLGAKPTPTAQPTQIAAPTEVPVNLAQYTIAVLNGSGITGQAGKIKDSLTSGGFTVNSTGNAANANFTKTEISAKKSVSPAYVSKLEDELKKTLDVDSTVATSPDSDSTDVTVTLGSSTGQ